VTEQSNLTEKELRTQERLQRRRERVLPDCREVHRLLADRAVPDDPTDLTAYELRILSSGGEDGIVHEVLHRAGFPTRRSVEIGCGANGGNSGVLAACFDYDALMLDGDEELVEIARNRFRGKTATIEAAWITREGVNDLVAGHAFTGEIDYLGIDLDGMDYWIWESLTVCDPLLVVAEYNALWGPDVSATVAYEPSFDRHGSKDRGIPKGYYGVSLSGVTGLAERRGYRLVATSNGPSNAFFLKEGVCPELPGLTASEAWKPNLKGNKPDFYARFQRAGVLEYFASYGWPLVELPPPRQPREPSRWRRWFGRD
jgi:hypothetical protein